MEQCGTTIVLMKILNHYKLGVKTDMRNIIKDFPNYCEKILWEAVTIGYQIGVLHIYGDTIKVKNRNYKVSLCNRRRADNHFARDCTRIHTLDEYITRNGLSNYISKDHYEQYKKNTEQLTIQNYYLEARITSQEKVIKRDKLKYIKCQEDLLICQSQKSNIETLYNDVLVECDKMKKIIQRLQLNIDNNNRNEKIVKDIMEVQFKDIADRDKIISLKEQQISEQRKIISEIMNTVSALKINLTDKETLIKRWKESWEELYIRKNEI
jgi:hypothetical protein